MGLAQGRRTGLAGARYPAQGRFAEVDGVRLHYEQAGSGKAVLLLHGSPGLTRDFKVAVPLPPDEAGNGVRLSLFQDLARDHRVIVVDRPGHGWSERDGHRSVGLLRQAELMAGLLDKLDASPAVVVGHSYGGALALAMAVEEAEQVEAVVILGTPAYSDAFAVEPIELAGARPFIGPLFNWTVGGLLASSLIHDGLIAAFSPDTVPEGYEEMFATFVARPANLHQRAYELGRLAAELDGISRHYSELEMPLTIMVGAVDQGGALKSAARLSDSFFGLLRVLKIPDLGHEIPQLRPELVSYEVRSITRGARAAASAGT